MQCSREGLTQETMTIYFIFLIFILTLLNNGSLLPAFFNIRRLTSMSYSLEIRNQFTVMAKCHLYVWPINIKVHRMCCLIRTIMSQTFQYNLSSDTDCKNISQVMPRP